MRMFVNEKNLLVVEVEVYQICSPKLKHEKERHEQKGKDMIHLQSMDHKQTIKHIKYICSLRTTILETLDNGFF